MLHDGIEEISMEALRGLGLTIDEGHVFLVEVGKDLSRTIMNGYWNTHDYPSPATNHSPVTLTF
jgi:hypothetical protein